MSEINIEDVSKHFGNCKTKDIRKFQEKTPEGNYIEGYICKKSNFYLGSLVITKVNGEDCEQFVQSMPKIEYFNNDNEMCYRDADLRHQEVCAYEKLDGSCLIVYPLFDAQGHIIEVIPKTRGRAVADKNFLSLYDKCAHGPILEFYYHNHDRYRKVKNPLSHAILYFEMYGILNQHEIIHYDTGIDLRLIGCYNTRFFKPKALGTLCSEYGFVQPDKIFVWEGVWGAPRIRITSRKFRWYFDHVNITAEDLIAPTAHDAIYKMKELLEYLNKKFNEQHGRLATEGVVINCSTCNKVQKYIKVKPREIEVKHRLENGIPKSDIRKEVLKYFDDYGSEVDEIYKENPNHHTEYIHRMLAEDYPQEYIDKSKKKIESIFMNIWEAKQVPISTHNLCDELVDKYGDQGITHCMRMFAQEYPMKKKDSRAVYQILEIKFHKRGLTL